MSESLLIYVAGPYSAPSEHGRIANTERALAAGLSVMQRGHYPIIPHLSHWFDLWHEREHGQRLDGEVYMQWDFVLLMRCDALLYLAPSPGADRELALAESLGMPVYRTIDDVPVAAA
jgi:hypothetical protein